MLRDLGRQGVRHAEAYLSIGILYHFARIDVDEVMAAAERGRVRGERDFGVTLLWIIDAVRHFGVDECARVFTKAARLRNVYPSVVGIGIGGDEARGPAHDFREIYAEAKAAGLHLTCHAGESTGPQSVWAAINIGAERIGHALTAAQDPDLIAVLAEEADSAGAEYHLEPAHRLLRCFVRSPNPGSTTSRKGLMITLNSDDPPFFGANLLDEYLLVHREFELTLDQMRELAANSRLRRAFLPPERKTGAPG